MQVKCPTCGKPVEWATSNWKPFCSERCKLIDLGAWASQEYRIPEKPMFEENLKNSNDADNEK